MKSDDIAEYYLVFNRSKIPTYIEGGYLPITCCLIEDKIDRYLNGNIHRSPLFVRWGLTKPGRLV